MEPEIFEPRELGFPEDKRVRYKRLVEEDKLSPFYGKPLKYVFMCAFALGYKNGKKEKFRTKRRPDIRFESLSDRDKWLLISVAIKEIGNISDIPNEKYQRNIWEIAEEYANGGINLLYDLVYEPGYEGVATKKLESELRERLKEIK